MVNKGDIKMTEKKNQATIKVRSETYDEIKFLSEKSGLSKTQLLAEVFDAIFQIGCTFSALNLSYDYCLTENRISITVEGKNNLVSGQFKVKEVATKPIEVIIKPKPQKVTKK